MAAETTRKIKRKYHLNKSSALRQRLQGKEAKRKKPPAGMPSIQNIIEDPQPKLTTHFSLKALAHKGTDTFLTFSHTELDFLMMGYNIPITRDSKQVKSTKLTEILKSLDAIPNPENLCKENFDKMKSPAPPALNHTSDPQGSVQ